MKRELTFIEKGKIIELHIGYGFSTSAIAMAFKVNEIEIKHLIDKDYSGRTEGRTRLMRRVSKLNTRADIF